MKQVSLMKKSGFTLIELLIVVAIIAILAAIAVPNFLEAQVRAKVSRAKADMRTLATGIESYYVDNNVYPMLVAPNSPLALNPSHNSGSISGPSIFNPGSDGVSTRFIWITTPIAYITSVFRDPFIPPTVGLSLDVGGNPRKDYDTYDYVDARSLGPEGILGPNQVREAAGCSGAAWHVVCAGPDRINAFGGGPVSYGIEIGVDYDPSNGTVSEGDVVRIASSPGSYQGTTDATKPAIDRVQNRYLYLE